MVITFFVGVIILSCLLFLNQKYKKTNEYRNTQVDINNYIEGVPNNLDIVNFGSTYSKYAFNTYDDLGINGFNFALQSESLEMDEKILHQYVNHISPNGVVIFVVAACLFLYKGNVDNLLYYKILSKEKIPRYQFRRMLKVKYPLFFNPKKIKYIINDSKKNEGIYENYQDTLVMNEIKEEMDNLVGTWKDLFDISDLKKIDLTLENKMIISLNCEILKRMIKFCCESGLRPIVVIPPFSNLLNLHFSEEFKEKIISGNIKKITNSVNIPFLDYQLHEMFQDAPELFCDGGFRLNHRGSKLFIKQLDFDLKSYGIESITK